MKFIVFFSISSSTTATSFAIGSMNFAGFALMLITLFVLIGMIGYLVLDARKKINKQISARAFELSRSEILNIYHLAVKALMNVSAQEIPGGVSLGSYFKDLQRIFKTAYAESLIFSEYGQSVLIALNSPLDEVLARKPYRFLPEAQLEWLAKTLKCIRSFCKLEVPHDVDGQPSDNSMDNSIMTQQMEDFRNKLNELLNDPQSRL